MFMYLIGVLQAIINVVMCVFHIFYKVNFDFLTENSSKISKHVVTISRFRISYVLVYGTVYRSEQTKNTFFYRLHL